MAKTLANKTRISLSVALLFIIVSHPQVAKLLNNVLPVWDNEMQCKTNLGIFVHTLLFFILNMGQMMIGDMNNEKLSVGLKIKYSFWSTLMFFVLSNEETYILMNNLYPVAGDSGCPNKTGIIIHAIIYFILLIGVMYLPPDMN